MELVAFLPLPAVWAVAVSVASGEIAFLEAVALLGTPFVVAVKDKIKSLLWPRREPTGPKHIGHARHIVGVTFFGLSIAPYCLVPGVPAFAHPREPDPRVLLELLLAGEALFFISLFELGEEFWARLKKLFEWPGAEQAATARDANTREA